MRKINNSKGAVELSLNLIIMLVIGFVVLALVIGFVTQMIDRGTVGLGDALSGQEEQIKDGCMSETGNVAVCPGTVSVKAGKTKKFFIKVFNPTDSTLEIGQIDGVGQGDQLRIQTVAVGDDCTLEVKSASLRVNSKDANVVTLIVDAGNDCAIGDEFLATAQYEPDTSGDSYDEQFSIMIG